MARRPNPEIQAGITPSPRKKKKPAPHPASRVPISRAEMRQITAITGANIAGAAIGAGERVTNRALTRVAQSPTHRPSLLHQALGPLSHDVGRLADIGSGIGHLGVTAAHRFEKLAASNPQINAIEQTTHGKPVLAPKDRYTGEQLSDAALGKSATNLLFHGNTHHLGASALEIGTMFPIFRGARLGAKAVVEGAGHLPAAEKAVTRVADVLPAAKKARKAQDAGYSVERGKRFGNAGKEFGQAGGGLAGHHAAKGMLRGELPKIDFSRLREGGYTQAELDRDINRIYEHPDLRQGHKTSAADGLENMFLKGLAPQPKQIELLNTVFGVDETAKLVHQSLGQRFADVLGIPRTLMASADVSAPFRQGLVAGARHPALFSKDIPKMFKALVSEKSYQGILDEIHARPSFPKMQEAGVSFTELGRNLNKREEQFISSLAERPVRVGGKNINLPGRIVHASGRAYTGFLDRLRADMFDAQLKLAAKAGVNTEDPQQLRAIADLVNNATGRGRLPGKTLENSAPLLNALFFSPRLIASRVNMIGLNPHWYVQLTPFARKQAIRSMVQLGAAATGVLGVGAYFGGKVVLDPRNADFAKLKRGNSRYDVLGGFQQYIRVVSQMATGKSISSATGEISSTGPGPLQKSRWDIGSKFLQGKLAPVPSIFMDALKGTNYAGQPFNVKKEIAQHTIPLVAQDAYAIYGDHNSVRDALIGYGIASFGIGSQTYANPNIKKRADKYKAWKTEAETVWKASHHIGPLPAELIRAKQNTDTAALKLQDLKKSLGKTKIDDIPEKDKLRVYVEVLGSQPQFSQYLDSWLAQVDAASEIEAKNLMPRIKKRLGYGVIEKYGKLKGRVSK